MLRREDGLVDWNQSAIEIERRLRAFQPWPGLYTTWSGRTLKLLSAKVGPVADGGYPGVVRGLLDSTGTDSGLIVGTGSGTLGVHRLQLEGKRAMTAGEFARGNAGIVGATLGGGMAS
jgi:methionyl-tRNA formyltransferase